MPVNPTDHYKLILQQHNHAADFRLKILYGWGLSYAGLAITFNWVFGKKPELSWIVPAVGIAITWLIWYFDVGNRHGLISWRNIGRAFEKNHVPKNQRYFRELTPDGLGFSIDTATFGIDNRGSRLSPQVDHGNLIDTAAVVIISLLAALTTNLVWTCGVFLGKQDNPTLEVSANVSKVIITLLVWGSVWFCWEKWEKARDIPTLWKTREKIFRVTIFLTLLLWMCWGFVYFQSNWLVDIIKYIASHMWLKSIWGVILLQVLILIAAILFYMNRYRRATLIFSHPNEEIKKKIQEKAYFLWEENDKPEGYALENWLQAEREIKHDIFAFHEALLFKK